MPIRPGLADLGSMRLLSADKAKPTLPESIAHRSREADISVEGPAVKPGVIRNRRAREIAGEFSSVEAIARGVGHGGLE